MPRTVQATSTAAGKEATMSGHPMSRGLPRESRGSIVVTYLYLGALAAIFAGVAWSFFASFQPTRLPNPGLTAYHPPALLALYPPPRLYSSPAPEIVAEAESEPASSVTSTIARQVQREPSPKGLAPRKSKRTASRPSDPRNPFVMTYTQFHSYGYFRPW
jgi:hypothetical protein